MIRTEWCMAWLTCVSVLALPAPAHSAGDGDGSTATGATPTASAPADEGRVGLEEIVVTAQKRSESISKVGMTITAFTGAALAEQNINNVADLAHITPGLTYAQSTLGTPVYTLRGVGFYDSSLAAYPAVSVYVDEVPLPFPALTTQAGFDLERVEVLKGPQGILFGQNSTGGAINYIAAKPTKDLQSGFTASYGRFDTFEGEGFVSGPLAESVTARLAVKVADGGDWQQSYTRNDTLGKSRVFDGRMLLDWSPTDRARFELNLNGWLDKSDPQVGQYYEFFPQLAVISPALANFSFAPGNGRAADWTPSRRPKRDNTQYQAALRGDFDLTDAITFTSISSYIDFQRDEVIDADGMSLDAYDQATKGSIQSFTQELRVTNKSASALRWLMGSNYENSRVDDNWLEGFHDSTVGSTLNFNTNGYYANQKLKNYAFFGNVEGDVTQSLTLKGGVRYANNKRDLETCTYDSGDGGVAGFFSFLSSLLTGTSVTIPPGGCVQLGPNFLPEGTYRNTLQQSNVSWRGGLDFKPTDTMLYYINAAKGFKAGSFPVATTSSDRQFRSVTQESVLDIEGGFKFRLFDRTLSLDGAVFHYDYTDKQLRSSIIDPIFGVLNVLVNVPKSVVKGAELAVGWAPLAGLNLSLSTTYLDGNVTSFTGINASGISANFAGTPMPFAPKWESTAGAEYRWPVARGYSANIAANGSYNSRTYSEVGGTASSRIEPYGLLDLRAGIESPSGNWRFTLWGKNVTNKYYWTNTVAAYDEKLRFAGMPATYGIRVSYRSH